MIPVQQQINLIRTTRFRLLVGVVLIISSAFNLQMIGLLALVPAILGAVMSWLAILTRCPFCGGFFFVGVDSGPVKPIIHRFSTFIEKKPWCVRCGYEP